MTVVFCHSAQHVKRHTTKRNKTPIPSPHTDTPTDTPTDSARNMNTNSMQQKFTRPPFSQNQSIPAPAHGSTDGGAPTPTPAPTQSHSAAQQTAVAANENAVDKIAAARQNLATAPPAAAAAAAVTATATAPPTLAAGAAVFYTQPIVSKIEVADKNAITDDDLTLIEKKKRPAANTVTSKKVMVQKPPPTTHTTATQAAAPPASAPVGRRSMTAPARQPEHAPDPASERDAEENNDRALALRAPMTGALNGMKRTTDDDDYVRREDYEHEKKLVCFLQAQLKQATDERAMFYELAHGSKRARLGASEPAATDVPAATGAAGAAGAAAAKNLTHVRRGQPTKPEERKAELSASLESKMYTGPGLTQALFVQIVGSIESESGIETSTGKPIIPLRGIMARKLDTDPDGLFLRKVMSLMKLKPNRGRIKDPQINHPQATDKYEADFYIKLWQFIALMEGTPMFKKDTYIKVMPTTECRYKLIHEYATTVIFGNDEKVARCVNQLMLLVVEKNGGLESLASIKRIKELAAMVVWWYYEVKCNNENSVIKKQRGARPQVPAAPAAPPAGTDGADADQEGDDAEGDDDGFQVEDDDSGHQPTYK